MGRAASDDLVDDIDLTYEDYLQLPDDGNRYEILDGELAVTPSPVLRHQEVLQNLHRVLDRHVLENGLGKLYFAPVDVILSRKNVLVPDLVFIPADRQSIMTDRAIEGPPDLVVEILSPSTASRDLGIKRKLYARFGVPHYWVLDPEARTLDVHRRFGRGYRRIAGLEGNERFRPALFPDLEIDLAAVWA